MTSCSLVLCRTATVFLFDIDRSLYRAARLVICHKPAIAVLLFNLPVSMATPRQVKETGNLIT